MVGALPVRYFVGTVVGAGIVLFLAHLAVQRSSGTVQFLSGSLIQLAMDGGTRGLLVIGAIGLTYCYIASCPMMILHAGRSLLFDRNGGFHAFFYVILGVVLTAIGLVGAGAVFCDFSGPLLAVLIFVTIFASQLAIIVFVHADSPTVKELYLSLGEARSAAVLSNRSESVDTYRHLREHSNAYAIIILELLLGAVLAQAPNVRWLIATTILWLLPAAYCWFFVTLLEVTFAFAGRKKGVADGPKG